MKVVVGLWKVKADKREDFIAASKAVAKASKHEAGLLSYSFSESQIEANNFVFLEEWKDDEAIAYHVSQPYFKSFIEQTKDMLVEDFTGTIYSISGMEPF
ncbi:MAG: putative quinol monooxygenase [Bacteroidota bacterium]